MSHSESLKATLSLAEVAMKSFASSQFTMQEAEARIESGVHALSKAYKEGLFDNGHIFEVSF